jgi:soluble lytic murein transglycosylase-like protein
MALVSAEIVRDTRMPRLVFLMVLSMGIVSGMHVDRAFRPELKMPTISQIKQAAKTIVAKPAAPEPSVYEQEAAMGSRELIARWEPFIAAAAREYHLSADWIRAVMRMESGGRTMLAENSPITSQAGAMGLMQVMPDTYNDMRAAYGLGADPYDPHDNIFAGAAYLRALHRKYGFPAMFAAYNDGPGNLENHLAGKRDLPDETRNYLSGIAKMLGRKRGAGTELVAVTRGSKTTFTGPDGRAVAVDLGRVKSVRKPLPGEYADGVNAVITVGKRHQGVREDLATVARLTLRGTDASM